ncbi:MAG: DNA polymerase Y family protein [Ilumatobacter sp.]|nr:DNA polymerase Y family protein [Ilumatobacter sp.]
MAVPTRMVAVWCPDWPVVAAHADPAAPAAVLHANRVVAVNPAARDIGVGVGHRRRQAQSICPELDLYDHDPDRDAREFEPVVRLVADMAPRLEIVEPGLIAVAARGPSRYFGGDRSLADQLVERVAPIAPVAIGVADGRSAATIAARVASRRPERVLVVDPGDTPGFVAGLPVSWLAGLGEITPDLVDLFVRMGLRTLGQVAALDPGDVFARFGDEGRRAHRVASGADDRALATTDPPPEWWADHPFDEPIHQLETVVFAAKRLADRLAGMLAADGRVCTRLVVIAESEHGERSERAWYRDRGMTAVAMVERVRWQLDGWVSQPGAITGGIVLVRLVPDEVRSDDGVQARLWGERSQADLDAGRAVVRLTGLAGDDRVRVPVWRGGRLPDERYRWVPASSVDVDDLAERSRPSGGPWPGALPAPSPAVVYDEPVDVVVVGASGEPVRVNGRGDISEPPVAIVDGSSRHVVRAWVGPWPIEQRWWTERPRRLARFQLVTDRGVAHLAAIERQRWVLLATYA